MGVLSSIFGERPAAPQTGGFTVGAEIPKELAPFYKDILGKSQALYNESVARGYEPYTGPSLAEFTPEQQQAFTGIAGLQGQQAPIYQEAMGMTRDAAAPITTEQIEEYMNPYQQAVVDIEKREAQKQYESQVVPQLAAKAAMAQPFGGSRQAILEGMAADTQQRLLGDIQAKGSAQAYQDAVNLIQNQRDRLGTGAGQLATLGANQFKSQLGEIGALQTVGEEKQQLAQQALNEAYGQYIKEQEFPFQQLGRYQSVVTGAPIQQTQYVPPTPPGPSVGQQLLGGAATMLGTYGAFGGKMPQLFGGATPAKTGGGIGDLPVIKAQQNKYLKNYLYNYMDPLPEDYGKKKDPIDPNEGVAAAIIRERDRRRRSLASGYRMDNPPFGYGPTNAYGLPPVTSKILKERDEQEINPFGGISTILDKKDPNKESLTLDQRALKALGLPYTPDNISKIAKMPIDYIKKLVGDVVETGQNVADDFKASITVDKQPLESMRPEVYPEGKSESKERYLPGEKFVKKQVDRFVEKETALGDKVYNYLTELDFLKKKDRVSPNEIKNVLSKDTTFLKDIYKDVISTDVNTKVIDKAENLLERPVPPEQLENLNKKPVKTITAINNNDTSLNKSITKNEDKVVETGTNYGNLITKKEQGDKVSKTNLASAQDKYLEAVKKMNDGLDKKDALINKAQQESFWAFVARVGANISKGAGISESVAAELPQAMKDRKSLIQAKSDLEDKKLAGKVDVAKAGLEVEKSRTSAKIAKAKERQRQIEALRDDKIAYLRALNTGSSGDRKFSLPTSKEIEDYTDITSDILNGIADGSRDLSTYFNPNDNINIAGVNNQEDLNSAFKLLAKNKTFMKDLATYLNNAKLSEDYLLNMDRAISLGIKNVLADNKYSYNKEKGIIFDKKEITKR